MPPELTPAQLDQVIDSYCNRVVDEMDTKTMERMLYELLLDSFISYEEKQFKELVVEVYGEDYYNELVEETQT